MNILICSVGRRVELVKIFKSSMKSAGLVVATDLSPYAPALYFADKRYLVPPIGDSTYIETILNICKRESIDAVTTLIDPEIEILASNKDRFEELGVEVLAPNRETAKLCFDKHLMFEHLRANNIPTVMTWGTIDEFRMAYESKGVLFPVFVKPRTGSGSVGARKINTMETLCAVMADEPSLIVQEHMDCADLDADVYVDAFSHEAVAAFLKRKIETRIGGASKTRSFKDPVLFDFICRVVRTLEFSGPLDMDFFYRDGQYYLSEINPRFGGAYPHAHGAGVDFIRLIENNISGQVNVAEFGNYEEDLVMMMYDGIVIRRETELATSRGCAGD